MPCSVSTWKETLFLCCLLDVLVGCVGSAGLDSITVPEGSDVILNCADAHKRDLRSRTFDWKKDDKMEIFYYNSGRHYNNGFSGQDPQFKHRVSHFEDQLTHGNASIRIKDTRVSDSGNYSCIFPKSNQQTADVRLIVQFIFKDRSGENRDAVSKIDTEILDAIDVRVPLRCEVQGAFPEPEVWWQDDEGKNYSASEPQISEGGGRYNITITANVPKTATYIFFCVVRQAQIHHEIRKKIYVPERMFQVCKEPTNDKATWIKAGVIGGLIGGLIGVLIGGSVAFGLMWRRNRNRRQKNHQNTPADTPLIEVQNLNGDSTTNGHTKKRRGSSGGGSSLKKQIVTVQQC